MTTPTQSRYDHLLPKVKKIAAAHARLAQDAKKLLVAVDDGNKVMPQPHRGKPASGKELVKVLQGAKLL